MTFAYTNACSWWTQQVHTGPHPCSHAYYVVNTEPMRVGHRLIGKTATDHVSIPCVGVVCSANFKVTTSATCHVQGLTQAKRRCYRWNGHSSAVQNCQATDHVWIVNLKDTRVVAQPLPCHATAAPAAFPAAPAACGAASGSQHPRS